MSRCWNCGREVERARTGRPARFCSSTCRVYFHRGDKIPTTLTGRRRWVRRTSSKRPVDRHGAPASSTDPRTWTSYRSARASTAGAGVGFVLGEGIGCVDLDHCLRGGVLDPVVSELLQRCPDTFTEASPSGEGLHVWGLVPEGPGSRFSVWGAPVEVYSRDRYITVTADRFGDCPRFLADLSQWVTWLRSERD